ncbi:glutathione S-transferase [Ceratobasidium sp. AG-Ba]|nr:glutathione S-transferase [Ceratobasidium sp. AG-Ba]
MAATPENPIIFYDIVAKDGSYWTPNTFKTRLTLNYKGLPYRVEWVKIEDVEPLMKEMGVPPTSKTYPHYTLPMIADPSSEPDGKPTLVSESFRIAEYLDEKYPAPEYPIVIPPGTRALQKIFVEQYAPSIAMAPMPAIASGLPAAVLDEASTEYMYRTRGRETFNPISEETSAKILAEAREKWEAFALTIGDGPWITGDTVTFADFFIAGWLFFGRRISGGDEGKLWKEVSTWQDGKWAEYWKRIEEIEKKSSCPA